jgi:salicylate hydroxylase
VINCVGIVRADQWLDDGWSIEADPDEVSNLYAGWHEEVTGLIRSGERMIKWGLFDRKPLERWSQGRVTLLGDAAHPMLPFLGLGAAMAIEDAMILARALHAADDIEDGLAHYEAARLQRTTGIHEQSRRQGEIVQAADTDRFQPAAAPSHNPAYYAYDPVTAPI